MVYVALERTITRMSAEVRRVSFFVQKGFRAFVALPRPLASMPLFVESMLGKRGEFSSAIFKSARERFISGMDANVFHEVPFLTELLAASVTLEILDSRMPFGVLGQRGLVREDPTTLFASVFSFSGMDDFVGFQVAGQLEGRVAHVATKRPGLRMGGGQVATQQRSTFENPLTSVAFEARGPVLAAHVIVKGGGAAVDFSAVGAFVAGPRLYPVGALQMPGQ